MTIPTDTQSVQRFLGMIGYVRKFTPILSDIAKPLLGKDIVWHWNEEQENASRILKELLTKALVIALL